MLSIQEIRRNPDGLNFEQHFDLVADLQKRSQDILDIQEIQAVGKVSYDDGLYFLDYHLSYVITLASSRSLEPVRLEEAYPVNELFIEADQVTSKRDMVEEAMVLVIEGDRIDLSESVADNILLNIPIKVLTPEEEKEGALPTGQDWRVLSEEEYQKEQEKQKEASNPFAGLQGLFDEE